MGDQVVQEKSTFADCLDEANRLLVTLKERALADQEGATIKAVVAIQDALNRAAAAAPDGGVADVTRTYRQAIEGILDLPFEHADVHNRYLRFILKHGRMPNLLESMHQINTNHERFYGHPFLQAEGLTLGQCRDCLEDPEGTRYGMKEPAGAGHLEDAATLASGPARSDSDA